MAGKTEPEIEDETQNAETVKKLLEFHGETLQGDIRDFLLDRLKANTDKSWSAMSEADQRWEATTASGAAGALIRKVVNLIAADGRDAMVATLKNVKNDGEKIDCTLVVPSNSEHRHDLFDAAGARVLVVVADPELYGGEKKPAKIDPDQPPLIEKTDVGSGMAAEAADKDGGDGFDATA